MRSETIRIFALFVALVCLTLTACSSRGTPSSSASALPQSEATKPPLSNSIPSSDALSEPSHSANSQSEAPQSEIENTSTAIFALGANHQDEKTMGIGDQIGDWKLVDLQIQYRGENINMLDAIFEGNVTLNGTISRNALVDYGFDFEVSKEDEAKMPYYIAPEMTHKDSYMFMLNFSDDIDETVQLEHGEQVDCKITISDYRFIFAYMTAPSSATVVDIEIL